MRRKLTLAVAVLVALTAVAALLDRDRAERTADPASEYFGINGSVLWLLARDDRMELLDRHLSEIEKLGLPFVRANLDWIQLEPESPVGGRRSYDYAKIDRWVGALASHGLRWAPLGMGTPAWARDPHAAADCSIFAPPADPADYAAMMAAVAARYGSDGSFWKERGELPYRPIVDYEIWNEPNLGGFWCPGPDPAAYGELLAAAAPAIRRVDPGARIVFGGLSPLGGSRPATSDRRGRLDFAPFLAATAGATPDLGSLVDAVAVHTYGSVPEVLDQLASYRRAVDGAGLAGMPLSLNEVGWTTNGTGIFDPVSEARRASNLEAVAREVALSDCGVRSLAPHTWVTAEEDPGDQEDWFGIADPELGTPYPSAIAYTEAAGEPASNATESQGASSRRVCAEP